MFLIIAIIIIIIVIIIIIIIIVSFTLCCALVLGCVLLLCRILFCCIVFCCRGCRCCCAVVLCSVIFSPKPNFHSWSRRYRIRGIRNIIFYGLPHYSLFYAEILNFLDTGEAQSEFGTGTGAATCTALYTRFDAHCVAGAVGTQRCKHMISSKKNVHLFVTGNQNT